MEQWLFVLLCVAAGVVVVSAIVVGLVYGLQTDSMSSLQIKHRGSKTPRRSALDSNATSNSPTVYADVMDDFMITTMATASTKAAQSYYPLILVTGSGTSYQMKRTVDSNPETFEQMDGLSTLWDWGKGVCHLLVWVGGLVSAHDNDPSFDWKANMNTQLATVRQTIQNLPTMAAVFKQLHNTTINTANATTSPVILIHESVDDMIRAATAILSKTQSFIESAIKNGQLQTTDVDAFISSVSHDATWLMWAVNDVVISRATRAMFSWKEKLSSDEWNNLYVIIGTGVADASSVVTPRGSCVIGNTSAQIFTHLMSPEQHQERVIMYTGDNLTFDIAPQIINPQSVSVQISKQFDDGVYSRMLATDLVQPNNALSTQFTNYSAKAVSADCAAGEVVSQSKCPYHTVTS